MHGTNVKKKK